VSEGSIGPYLINSLLGVGGMGEVYRARDTKLNRDVAIKILPAAFASDPERLARFKREAQVLASLSHPNIAAIHGFEDSDGVHALVLELVEGPALADRIAHGPIGIDEALPIARQIADALECAHEAGVVHRDLKPANIKVREDGTVKVLDFGLAKLAEPVGASAGVTAMTQSPTITTPAMTAAGMILGTAAYMSPEQAKGKPADKRSDIWAFGCVLYEMLTGRRAFGGEDVPDTLAAVLRGEPEWALVPSDVPPPIRALIRRCLERDRQRRIADISTARFAIDEMTNTVSAAQSSIALPRRKPPVWSRALPLIATTVMAAAIAGGIAWNLRSSSPAPGTITRFPLMLPDGQQFTNPGRPLVAFSPDGTRIAYVANQRLYVRSLSENEPRAIEGSYDPQGVTTPTFSPDGRSIAFVAATGRVIKRIAVNGGVALPICPIPGTSLGMSWGANGIVFGQRGNGIMRASPEGGEPVRLVSIKDGELAYGPQILPDGQSILFTLLTAGDPTPAIGNQDPELWDKSDIVVQSLQSGARTTLVSGGSDARYVPTGHLVYAISGVIFAVPFDVRRLRVVGERVPIVEGVSRGGASAAAQFSFSNNGSLAFVPGPVSTRDRSLALIDRKGAIEPLKLQGALFESPRVSPDGTRVAVGIDDGKAANVWIYDLAGTTALRQLTFDGRNRFPVWSADGQRIVFQSDREGDGAIFWQRADGSGQAERLTKADSGTTQVPWSWSADGQRLLFGVMKGSSSSLWMFSAADKGIAPFRGVSSDVTDAAFSPDGRWVAYARLAAARGQVFVEPFPSTGAKYLVAEGAHPAWSRNGTELFFSSAGSGVVEMVKIRTQPSIAFSDRVSVPGLASLTGGLRTNRNFDVTPDGTRFINVLTAAQEFAAASTAPQIQVVLNWFEELRARVRSK